MKNKTITRLAATVMICSMNGNTVKAEEVQNSNEPKIETVDMADVAIIEPVLA